MRSLLFIVLTFAVTLGVIPGRINSLLCQAQPPVENAGEENLSDFDKAVEIIKKYETLHQPRHWPLVGYGHKVLPGEKFSRTKAMGQKEAEELLRKDLLKNCAVFRSFGADSLILGVLAYNIGSGATLKSSVAKKLREGNRDIYDSYVAYSKYRGKTHIQLKNRRIEEFETLFIKEIQPASADAPEKEEEENTVIIEETI